MDFEEYVSALAKALDLASGRVSAVLVLADARAMALYF
jgi:hypothetical protein